MLEQHQARQTDDRRAFLGLALLGASGRSLAALTPDAAAANDEKSAGRLQELRPEGAPAAAPGYSPGIRAEGQRVIFVSGQGPKDLKADVETQIRQTFDRIGLVLKAGGATFRDVVMVRAYFVHLSRDLPVYRKVRMDYLSEPYPAATAVGVAELAIEGLEVEIEAVAIV
jgi:enamine deaminase RidA (YjgF/YER057c/UK114 family)